MVSKFEWMGREVTNFFKSCGPKILIKHVSDPIVTYTSNFRKKSTLYYENTLFTTHRRIRYIGEFNK